MTYKHTRGIKMQIKRQTKIQQGDNILQTTIPLTVVEMLNLKKGDSLKWEVNDGKASFEKLIQEETKMYKKFVNQLENNDVVILYYKLSNGNYISQGEYSVEGDHLIKFGGTVGVGDVYIEDIPLEYQKVERPTEYRSVNGDMIQQNKPYICWKNQE